MSTKLNRTATTSKISKRAGNVLDSTAPTVRRGKERERPKKKRKTLIKKLILKAREEKKAALALRLKSLEAIEHDDAPESNPEVKPEEHKEDKDETKVLEEVELPPEEPLKEEPEIDPILKEAKTVIHSKKFRE